MNCPQVLVFPKRTWTNSLSLCPNQLTFPHRLDIPEEQECALLMQTVGLDQTVLSLFNLSWKYFFQIYDAIFHSCVSLILCSHS